MLKYWHHNEHVFLLLHLSFLHRFLLIFYTGMGQRISISINPLKISGSNLDWRTMIPNPIPTFVESPFLEMFFECSFPCISFSFLFSSAIWCDQPWKYVQPNIFVHFFDLLYHKGFVERSVQSDLDFKVLLPLAIERRSDPAVKLYYIAREKEKRCKFLEMGLSQFLLLL